MGEFDVPANINYIYSITNQKVIYIGHSQGTTSMFAALSEPEISKKFESKIEKFIALAPIVYLANQSSTILNAFARTGLLVEPALRMAGVNHIMEGQCTSDSYTNNSKSILCRYMKVFCASILNVTDTDPEYDNLDRINLFVRHSPSGSSMQ